MAATVAFLASLIAVGQVAEPWIFPCCRVEVPDVVGEEVADARALLAEAGLGMASTREFAARRRGVVIAQDPEAGATVSGGARVDVVTSAGIRVPTLRGLALDAAVQRARRAGLEVAGTSQRHTTRPIGSVVEQEPQADTGVDPGSGISVVLSKGVQVPSVVGGPIAEAIVGLEGASLSVGEQARRFSRRPRDLVLTQEPEAGRAVEPGTAVALLVSNGTCPLRGRILTPSGGAPVAAGFQATGTLCSQRLGRRRAWTATEVAGGYFPKQRIAATSRRWKVQVFEDARSFSLVLLVVARADHGRILGWFEHGEQTGSFPALSLPTARPLDEVELVRR